MTATELIKTLREMYNDAPYGEQTTMIHLFGIKFASDINACGRGAQTEIAAAATGEPKYGTEIGKGVRLAKYVRLK